MRGIPTWYTHVVYPAQSGISIYTLFLRRLKAEETKRIANIIMQRQAQAQAQNVNNTPSPIITVGQNMANNRTVPGYNVYNQVPQQNPAGDDEITIIADKPGGKTLDPSMPITQQVINHVSFCNRYAGILLHIADNICANNLG